MIRFRLRRAIQIVSVVFATLAFYEMLSEEYGLSVALTLLALWAQAWRTR